MILPNASWGGIHCRNGHDSITRSHPDPAALHSIQSYWSSVVVGSIFAANDEAECSKPVELAQIQNRLFL